MLKWKLCKYFIYISLFCFCLHFYKSHLSIKKDIPLNIAENWKKCYKQTDHLQNEYTLLTAAEIDFVELTFLSIKVREQSCKQDAQEGT